MVEFKGFHAQFADCFSREEPRENFYQYMAGQMSQLERKTIEPIALNVESGKVRAMQHFSSDVVWEEERILSRYHGMVSEDLGDAEGVLISDESGFVKKGSEFVGVSRQYCGNVGEVENCRVGVYMAYASRHGYDFLDKSSVCLFRRNGLAKITLNAGRNASFPLTVLSRPNRSWRWKCWRRSPVKG